jgi:hypothetical protein
MMLRAIMGGVDLNLIGRYSEFFRGAARKHRQNAFRSTHGFSAVEHLHADCCALRWRRSGPNAVLRRAEQYRAMAFAQLVAIVKKRLVLEASLYTLLQVFSVTLFEKMPMSQALSKTRTTFEENEMGSQLNLFDF